MITKKGSSRLGKILLSVAMLFGAVAFMPKGVDASAWNYYHDSPYGATVQINVSGPYASVSYVTPSIYNGCSGSYYAGSTQRVGFDWWGQNKTLTFYDTSGSYCVHIYGWYLNQVQSGYLGVNWVNP